MDQTNTYNQDENAYPQAAGITLHDHLRSLISGFSIEVTPREALKIDSFGSLLPEGTSVYITALPNGKRQEIVSTAARLKHEGMNPVPHIAARSFENEASLDAFLSTLSSDAGITEALIIAGGSYPVPAGPFHSSSQLVETGLLEKHGIKRIGFAGHPEGHPDISPKLLLNALKEKQLFADRFGRANVQIVTQFFFASRPIIDWDKWLTANNISLPVRIGLHGLASVPSLIKHARYCGVGASVKTLIKQGVSSALQLASTSTPDKLIVELAGYTLETQDTRLRTCHFFPLGSFTKTAAWARAVADGQFELGEDGSMRVRINS